MCGLRGWGRAVDFGGLDGLSVSAPRALPALNLERQGPNTVDPDIRGGAVEHSMSGCPIWRGLVAASASFWENVPGFLEFNGV